MGNIKEISKDAAVKKLGLMDFSGDENFSPEIIDDALNSTSSFNKNAGIADIATRINSNKAKYNARRRA
jgi:hypothetical protein